MHITSTWVFGSPEAALLDDDARVASAVFDFELEQPIDAATAAQINRAEYAFAVHILCKLISPPAHCDWKTVQLLRSYCAVSDT
jgi:hypothetical protein